MTPSPERSLKICFTTQDEPRDPTDQHVAVVILNWNGRDHLETYLPSVLEHSEPEADVWVADNGSTDDSLAWLEANHPEVKTIALGRNHGFAEGYNKALAQVEADVYVLLNSDVRIVSRWIDPVLDIMDERGWSVASPLMVQDTHPRCASMLVQQAAGWTRTGFHFAWGVCSKKWKLWTIGTDKTETCFGLQVPPCLSASRRGSRRVDWTAICSRTWRKSICAGGFKTWAIALGVRDR